jgi:predicted NUDIX family NTP pyrophosphohydrolase
VKALHRDLEFPLYHELVSSKPPPVHSAAAFLRLGSAVHGKVQRRILMYRGSYSDLRLLLVHPGGPFWASKDQGAWSIPKGEYEPDEEPLICAIREFKEELGSAPQVAGARAFLELGELAQLNGKVITAWAVEGDFETDTLSSNLFEMEWPPKSGRLQSFPEVDLADWFSVAKARKKIQPGEAPLIDRLLALLERAQQ